MKIVKLYATTNRQHECPECKSLLHSGDEVALTRKTYRHLHCERIRLLHSAGFRWIERTILV